MYNQTNKQNQAAKALGKGASEMGKNLIVLSLGLIAGGVFGCLYVLLLILSELRMHP